jgi:hypothetical protein
MSVLPIGFGSEEGGYRIERSVRLNSSDSAYFSRTPASAGNRKTWTWSGWVKRSALGAQQSLFNADNQSVFQGAWIYFQSGDTLSFQDFQGTQYVATTTAVFRDPSAWYHIVVALDTTQATAANRLFIYVNGVSQAYTWGTTIAQNTDGVINTTKPHFVGRRVTTNGGAGDYFNGYLTDINFIDGSALDPTSFGEFNSETGVWQPKAYTGSYGTNGFYLNFSDNSGVTSTTLGADSSGNGNNWTPNNFSVTAGAGNDSLVDTPTNYGTDTGVGGEVRGNYCTWNPLRPNASMTYANGNLEAISSGGSGRSGYGTFGMSSGKWYFETTGGDNSVGVATVDGSVYAIYTAAGGYNINGTTTSGKATYTTSDVISCAYDADANTIEFFKNGSSQGSTSFSAAAGLSVVAQFNGTFSATRTCVANFGQRPFAYTAPSGFKALCTQNLPEPTIVDGGEYFNTVLWTGTGSGQSITGMGFQPDWLWFKHRNGTSDHALMDSVRGATKGLRSNSTAAEVTSSAGQDLVSFDSDGFTTGTPTNFGSLGGSGATIATWGWKANGAGVSNTDGTITSTVSANTDSGFSIVTYTGTGANATVGHGLGVAPNMIILKPRNSADNWPVWHSSFAVNEYVYLNLTNAKASLSTFMNSTLPSSTVISLGTWANTNTNTQTMVAYCFAAIPGYSAFGSYTGNGSADGPFVYLGFRPAFVMVKVSSGSARGWSMWDDARDYANGDSLNARLEANSSAAEDTGSGAGPIDILSNGFKIRNTAIFDNESGSTFIYAAFAENPFKYSLAR